MQDLPGAQSQRYSSGAVVLHWLLALCLSFELALGFAMPKDAGGFALFQLHKSVGITILLLSLVRLGWRMTHARPPAVERGITGALAKAVHFGFYGFMILGPLTGWAVASTAPVQIPTILFGIIPLAHLPLPTAINGLLVDAHELLAWIGLGLFLLHIAGALRHQAFLGDDLMKRMAPGGSNAAAIGLATLVVLTGTTTLLAAGGSAPVSDTVQPGTIAVLESTGETAEAREDASEQGELEAGIDASVEGEQGEGALPLSELRQEEEEEEVVAADPSPPVEPTPPPAWTIQPGGRLGFSVADGSGSRIRGAFGSWGGTIRFDPDRPESAEIRIDVDLSSASVGDPTQDEMLSGEDFLAIATGPTATFRSVSIRRMDDGSYNALGTLDLRGVSRQQSLTFTLDGKGLRRRVEGAGTIDRTAFGIGTGSTGANLGRSVSVEFSFDAAGRET